MRARSTTSPGAGPSETSTRTRRRPVRDAAAQRRDETVADWEELSEALADYTVSCNGNERLRRMQRDWSRILHFVCSDTDQTFTMDVDHGEIIGVREGHVGVPDIVVTTTPRRSATCSGET